MKILFLFFAVALLFSCNDEVSYSKAVEEVVGFTYNEILMNELKATNDSISFSFTMTYNLFKKTYSVNPKIYTSSEFSPTESKEKLKVESERIQLTLQKLKNYSAFNGMNLYLISNEKKIDSLNIKINN